MKTRRHKRLSDLDRGRLCHAIDTACRLYGPWPAASYQNSHCHHFSVDQILAVLEAPRLPVRRPKKLPYRSPEDLKVLKKFKTKSFKLVDDRTMRPFTRRETDAALAGVRIAWLVRDFIALGLRADGAKRGIRELLSEKKQVDRLVAVVCPWTRSLRTPSLQDAWLATEVIFNNRRGDDALNAFRLTTQQLLRALASSRTMLEVELRWQRDLDDRLNGSARASFIRDSIAPCFKEIYHLGSRGKSKGIWRAHDAAAVEPSVNVTATGPLISFAIEVFRIVGSDTAPETIDDALGRVREKKGRDRKEPVGTKTRPLKLPTILSRLQALLAEPAVKDWWSDRHSIYGPQSKLGSLDAYTATLDRLSQHENLQHVPRK